ncbi:MAG TPA: hypothetical protein VMH41_15125 [Mycobacteriales bacterium]|nr:hypothetical protein [Mycobacteriales bacterium]
MALSATIVAATLAPLSGSSIASASPTVGHRGAIRVLATDRSYVVYVRYPRATNGEVDHTAGTMYERTAAGVTHSLGSIDTSKWNADTDGLFSLAGPMLTILDPTEAIDWWNLDTRTHGTTDLPTDAAYLSTASPSGWLFVSLATPNDGSAMVIHQQATNGTVTRFAAPFGQPTGHQVETAPGPGGVLAVDDPAGTIDYLPWDKPNHRTHVKNPHKATSDLTCTGVTVQVARCAISYDKGDNGFNAHYDEVIFLDGHHNAVQTGALITSSKVAALRHHGSISATGRGLAVVGHDGHIYTLSYRGHTVHRAHGRVPRSATLVPGYRGIIVRTPSRIAYLARPSGHVTRIARAPSS